MNKTVRSYLLLCFALTYFACGGLAVYTRLNNMLFSDYTWMYVVYVIGVISPAIAAIFVWIRKERYTLKQVRQHLFKFPRHRIDWLLMIGVVAAFQLLPYAFFGLRMTGALTNVFLYIPTFIIIGGLEEVGWRGFWLEKLLVNQKWTTFKAALVIGLAWEAWHVPLFGIMGTYQQQYLNLGIHTLWTLALSFALTGLYIRSRSTLLCILTHCLINSFGEIFILKMSWIEAVLKLIACLAFFLVITHMEGKKRGANNKIMV